METLNNEEVTSDQTNTISSSVDSSFDASQKVKQKPSLSLRLLNGILTSKMKREGRDDILDPVVLEALSEFDSIIEYDARSVVDFWDTIGKSLLEKAIDLYYIDIVYSLLKHADDSLIVPDQSTLLFSACDSDHLELAKMLLKRGADVNEWRKDSEGWATCLHIASRHGHMPLMRSLIEYGAPVNTVHFSNDSPIIDAAVNGKIDAVRLLLDHGADVDLVKSESEDIGYGTALSCACAYNYVEVAELLLDHGADINFTNQDGNTPLLVALLERPQSLAVIPLLLSRDADISIVNREGRVALDYVTADSETAQMIENSQLEHVMK